MIRSRMFLAVLVATLMLGACAQEEPTDEGGETQEEETSEVTLRAGMNDPEDRNIAITEFLPERAAVRTGTTVTWTFAGPEPHSVTFFPAGQAPPPPGSDPTLTEPTEQSDHTYNSSTLINSGLRPFGPEPADPFNVTFPDAGTFNYVCVIHPLMTGEITVADDGGDVDSQQEITSRGDAELERWLQDGRQAKQRLVSAPVRQTAEGDATVWTVEMGATTEHTDVLAFAPVEAAIEAGDRVVFINNSEAPHTATFSGGQPLPQNPESPEAMQAAPGSSPQTLTNNRLFNTGWLPPNAPPGGAPPEAARSFTFVVPTAGEYDYVCLLHAPSGMIGTIRVA